MKLILPFKSKESLKKSSLSSLSAHTPHPPPSTQELHLKAETSVSDLILSRAQHRLNSSPKLGHLWFMDSLSFVLLYWMQANTCMISCIWLTELSQLIYSSHSYSPFPSTVSVWIFRWLQMGNWWRKCFVFYFISAVIPIRKEDFSRTWVSSVWDVCIYCNENQA